MYVSNFMSHVLFIIVYKLFVNLLKRVPRKIGPPIGLPSVNKVYLLTYLLYLLTYLTEYRQFTFKTTIAG